MATQIEDLIGQTLVIGVPGTKVTPEIVKQFKDTRAGGIIFYRINFESPDQIKKMITDLENALERKLLVCVDHEGGRVIMYRDGITIFPDNLAIGTAGKVEWAAKQGEIAAKELRALGTDINFSPCLDVLTESYSPNIGIRSYGKDFHLVAEMGAAYIAALQKGGVAATAKHFPGKGHAPVDAHLKLPTIQSTWDEMKKVHLQPFFRAIDVGVECIMSSHPYYPRLDPDSTHIATFSRRIIYDFLRDELDYDGLIVSDDLEMGAVKDICPIDIAAVRTMAAGHDVVLSCHDLDSQRRVFQGLLDAYKGRQLPIDELEASIERIHKMKDKHPSRFEGKVGPVGEGSSIAAAISTEAVRVIQDKEKMLPLPTSLRSDVGVVFPKISSFAPKIMIERIFEDELSFIHYSLGKYGVQHAAEIYNIDPTEEDIRNASDLAARSSVVLFFCFDAHLYPNEQQLLQALQKSAKKLVMVMMRDPYDNEFLRSQDAAINCFGFRACQLTAMIDYIFKK